MIADDKESCPSDTSEHNHIALSENVSESNDKTLLGHLNVERQIIPKPSMIVKNDTCENGHSWNFCSF